MVDEKSILVVDDDKIILDSLCEFLRLEGFQTAGAETQKAAMTMLEKQSPCLVITDVSLPDGDGFDLLEAVKKILQYEEDATIKFIIATNDNLEQLRKDTLAKFAKMKKIADLAGKQNIKLELWDDSVLRRKEKELGIYL